MEKYEIRMMAICEKTVTVYAEHETAATRLSGWISNGFRLFSARKIFMRKADTIPASIAFG
ncbi:hypothetical protein NE619_17815 [Anaerovorax odorimutans]|uniref:Uncharacterized protein n=1 Tax=Anaerovorax odorimutans TaxID=109327 RepID=A0ABT1RTZ4_9FIRM|nr:hypothetical protein [Anaerovorax odorimutans]MCQ4638589.1 hypothetical protein [Anaerovorax odorimutans]